MNRWILYRGLLRAALAAVALAFAGEVSLRVFFAVKARDPGILLYSGRRTQKSPVAVAIDGLLPDRIMDGYAKYSPNPRKRIHVMNERGELAPYFACINGLGYRGEEAAARKEAGTVRVVCLGESSTFGAFVKDDETYPSLLEEALSRSAGPRYEVVNLGVSESVTDWLPEMLEREILPLNPDVVTFLGGHNDIRNHIAGDGPLFFAARRDASLLLALLRARIGRRDRSSDAYAVVGPRYEANLLRLAGALRERGIAFIVVKQKIRPPEPGLAGKTYAEYHALLSKRLADGPGLPRGGISERAFSHYRLMQDLDRYAPGNFVLVDGIRALDRRDDLFVTHVHLKKGGNAVLAEALKEAILNLPGKR